MFLVVLFFVCLFWFGMSFLFIPEHSNSISKVKCIIFSPTLEYTHNRTSY